MTDFQAQFNLRERRERYDYLCHLIPIDPVYPNHPTFKEFSDSEKRGLVLISSQRDRIVISNHGTFDGIRHNDNL